MDRAQKFILRALRSVPEPGSLRMDTRDTERIIEICARNRLLPIMYRVVRDSGLEKHYRESAAASLACEHEARMVFDRFSALGVRAILLRGLYLGLEIYRNPSLRPFNDMDVLVERRDIQRVKDGLRGLGFHYKQSLLPEEFFLDAHLHLVYEHPQHGSHCEVHWAVDHPFTTYAIDMEEVFASAIPMDLGGIQCWDIKRELRFILLLVHLQKHLPSLKYLHESPDLLEEVIGNGELLHVLDAYLFLKSCGHDLDWHLFADTAARWNVDGVMHSTLKTVENVFGDAVPAHVFEKIPPPAERPMERFLACSALSRACADAVASNLARGAVFSGRRLSDLYCWFIPDRNTIVRKYGVKSRGDILRCYGRHFVACVVKLHAVCTTYVALRMSRK